MAQPELQKFTRRGLAMKLQAAAGTPESVSAATDGVQLYNGTSGTEQDVDRSNPDAEHFNARTISTFNHRAFIQGDFYLMPPATPGDDEDGLLDNELLLFCGGMTRVLDEIGGTTRYNPITHGIPIQTAHWWHAGTFLEVFDARNAISGLSMEIGRRYGGQVRIQGNYTAVGEDDVPAVSAPDGMGPIIESHNSQAHVRLLGAPSWLNVWSKALNIEFGSQLATAQFSELKVTDIDARDSTYTLRIARTANADFDPNAIKRSGAFIEAKKRVISANGKYIEQGICGQIENVQPAEFDGKFGWEITGPCVAVDGGDEFYIEAGTHA